MIFGRLLGAGAKKMTCILVLPHLMGMFSIQALPAQTWYQAAQLETKKITLACFKSTVTSHLNIYPGLNLVSQITFYRRRF